MKFTLGMAQCHEYVELIQNVVDGESTKEEEKYLRRHLRMCLKCLERLNLEKELKKALQLKLENKEVPAGLADSILEKISKKA